MEDFEIIENEIYPEMDESRITQTVVHMKEASRLPFLLCGLYSQTSKLEAFERMPGSPWSKSSNQINFIW